MACLSPKALSELWNQMLSAGRVMDPPFGWKNSDAFIEKVNRDFNREFPKKGEKK